MESSRLFELNGKMPPLKNAIPIAAQHLVTMIVGCVTPAIIISSVAGLDEKMSIVLIQSSLVLAAISTLLQLFGVTKFCGARLPVIIGVSFAYLSVMIEISTAFGLEYVFGAQLVGGIVAILFGIASKKLNKFFPPLITGTVVFTIGLSLYPTAITYMAGGSGNPNFGSLTNWGIAIFTLIIVTALNHYGKGMFKLASILIGIICGYIVSLFFGLVDFSAIARSEIIAPLRVVPFGIKFEISSIITMSILFVINSVQAIGDFNATTMGGLDREPTSDEIRGGIIGFGVSNVLSSLFGGLPNATYSQNVGIVSTTKVVNKRVLSLCGIFLLVAGLIPKFSAFLTTIPQCVLGGATVSVFASIAMTGMKLVATEDMNYRNTSIVGLSAALGMGINLVKESLAQFPSWVTMVFGSSPVIIAALVAIVLNIILPKEFK